MFFLNLPMFTIAILFWTCLSQKKAGQVREILRKGSGLEDRLQIEFIGELDIFQRIFLVRRSSSDQCCASQGGHIPHRFVMRRSFLMGQQCRARSVGSCFCCDALEFLLC